MDRDLAVAGRRACLCQCRLDSVGHEEIRASRLGRARNCRRGAGSRMPPKPWRTSRLMTSKTSSASYPRGESPLRSTNRRRQRTSSPPTLVPPAERGSKTPMGTYSAYVRSRYPATRKAVSLRRAAIGDDCTNRRDAPAEFGDKKAPFGAENKREIPGKHPGPSAVLARFRHLECPERGLASYRLS